MKVLVTGAFGQIDALRERFPEVTFEFWQNEKENVHHPAEYDGVICNAILSLQDATAFSNLHFVQLTAAGYDRVPLQFLEEQGVRVYNAADAYAIPMAEATIWGVLTLYRQRKASCLGKAERSFGDQRQASVCGWLWQLWPCMCAAVFGFWLFCYRCQPHGEAGGGI